MTRVFRNRTEAGRALAARLEPLRGHDVVVLGLPRGGVPVAFEVATHIDAPLDVIIVRKVGVPGQPELAMGAIGEDGARVVNDDVVVMVGVTEADFIGVESRERDELERRAKRFRGHAPRTPLDGRTAVIVDDGIATGSTARAACHVARAHGAARIVLAVPVAASESVASLRDAADEIICLEQPTGFHSVGQWYHDFTQVDDDTVIELLGRARRRESTPTDRQHGTPPASVDAEVEIDVGGIVLPGHLTVPSDSCGLVIFAHGSGSSRHSPRNQYVADRLNTAGLGTLTFDLLTNDEANDRRNVFDIDLLAARLVRTASWVHGHEPVDDLPIALLRREHRRGRRTGSRRSVGRSDRRRGQSGWPTRPGRNAPCPGGRTDAVDRRRRRHGRARAEPGGATPAALRAPVVGHSRRHPPVRGARHARRRSNSRCRMVRRTLHLGTRTWPVGTTRVIPVLSLPTRRSRLGSDPDVIGITSRRSGRDSSPCPRHSRSPSRTSHPSRSIRRSPKSPAAASWLRRRGRNGCRST